MILFSVLEGQHGRFIFFRLFSKIKNMHLCFTFENNTLTSVHAVGYYEHRLCDQMNKVG